VVFPSLAHFLFFSVARTRASRSVPPASATFPERLTISGSGQFFHSVKHISSNPPRVPCDSLFLSDHSPDVFLFLPHCTELSPLLENAFCLSAGPLPLWISPSELLINALPWASFPTLSGISPRDIPFLFFLKDIYFFWCLVLSRSIRLLFACHLPPSELAVVLLFST